MRCVVTRALVLLVALAATHPHHTLDCYTQPAACSAALQWGRARRRHDAARIHRMRVDLTRRYQASSTTAIRVACAVYTLPCGTFLRVARCESTFDPFARNGRYLGLFQLGGSHLADPIIEASSWSDPYANALHTARFVKAHGWSHSQWECF